MKILQGRRHFWIFRLGLLAVLLMGFVALPLMGCADHTADPDPTEGISFYGGLLEDYRKLVDFRLSEDFEQKWNSDQEINLGEQLTQAIANDPDAQWSNMIVEMTAGLEEGRRSSFGYLLRDISGDGFPELFWIRADSTVLAVFTRSDTGPVLVDAYWSGSSCVLTDDNELYTKSSGGAGVAVYQLQRMESDGKLVQVKEFGSDGLSEDAQPQYYEVTDGRRSLIQLDRLEELLRAYPFAFGARWSSAQIILLTD